MSEKRYCELRAQGRILSGVGIAYGDVATLPFGRERFQAGAFPGVENSDVLLNASHDRARPLARSLGGGLVITDSPFALSIKATLPQTREADDTLTLVSAQILRGLSLEFIARSERREGNVRIVERAELDRGLAVVDRPAYSSGSLVSAREEVRQQWARLGRAHSITTPPTVLFENREDDGGNKQSGPVLFGLQFKTKREK